jgi:hypothetical protein
MKNETYQGAAISLELAQSRRVVHITAGDATWTPTAEELASIVAQFQAANIDPLHTTFVATRHGVKASMLGIPDVSPESIELSEKLMSGQDAPRPLVDALYRYNDPLSPGRFRVVGIANENEAGRTVYVAYKDLDRPYRGLLALPIVDWNVDYTLVTSPGEITR